MQDYLILGLVTISFVYLGYLLGQKDCPTCLSRKVKADLDTVLLMQKKGEDK